MSFFQTALSLFFVLNALGNIPLFIGLLGRYDVKRQKRIIVRELLIALLILLLFNFFGDDFLKLLGITPSIICIAGGTLLFIIALGMIFPKSNNIKSAMHEPMIVPLAMPVVAGPGAIATVMIYSEQANSSLFMVGVILAAWLPSAIILFAASNIRRILGEKGIVACERLGGMLIILLAVKMISAGVIALVKNNF